MKITLSQHGGLAAFIKRPPIILDTGALDERTRARVEELARAALRSPPAQAAPKPDEISYAVQVEDGEQTAVLRGTDTAQAPDFCRLVQAVKKYGVKAKGPADA